MRLIEYSDVQAFHRDVSEALAAHEVVNNLPLGILNRGVGGEAKPDWFMARVESAEAPCELIALMTPPRNLLLAAWDRSVPEEAIRLLAEYMEKNRIVPPGVVAEDALSKAFARAFTEKSGASFEVSTSERLYRLDQVEDVPISGTLRLAQERDMHYLPYWMKAFADECFHANTPLDAETARWCIDRGTMYILEDGGLPVSMTGSSRQMPHGRAVGPVYTPPYLRARGYATAAVALLSRIILEDGNQYCALFTDLANPISNNIYQRIGYRPVADFAEIRFV
jgi:predicted GNAT family acetyltransferase